MTHAYRQRAKLRTDDLRETSLELLLMMLTRHGATFVPVVRIDGAEHLPAPADGPLLIVSRHTMLSFLFLRYLEDAGHEPFVIAAYPGLRISGTRRPARVLDPSPMLLFKVRRLLADGRTITAMIDRDRPDRRSASIDTPDGPGFISAALLQLARRCGARIVFLSTRLNAEGAVVCRLVAASLEGDLAALIADFAAAVDRRYLPTGRASRA